MAWKHQQEPQEMGEKLGQRFLGLFETKEHTLEQSHGIFPCAVAMAKTTLEGERACGYLLSKLSAVLPKEAFSETLCNGFAGR